LKISQTHEISIQIAAFLAGRGASEGRDLPPERELARQLGTSRVTLRRALGALESAGLLEPRRGSGCRPRAPSEWSLGALAWLLRGVEPAAREGSWLRPLVVEALALRRTFARGIPALLAGRLAKGSLARARRLTVEAWEARANAARCVALDAAALRSALEAAGAGAAVCLWNDLARTPDALAAWLPGALPVPVDYVARRDELWDALEAGESARAERAIGAHLARLDRGLLAAFEGDVRSGDA
jgi:DNA-binding FadR family transcriptional regulator